MVGPSGCGKPTALRMVAGLETITSGQLKFGDRIVNDADPKDRDIAMVFENYALYPHMSVFENVGLRAQAVRALSALNAHRVGRHRCRDTQKGMLGGPISFPRRRGA